jgi:hypothetical protein
VPNAFTSVIIAKTKNRATKQKTHGRATIAIKMGIFGSAMRSFFNGGGLTLAFSRGFFSSTY